MSRLLGNWLNIERMGNQYAYLANFGGFPMRNTISYRLQATNEVFYA